MDALLEKVVADLKPKLLNQQVYVGELTLTVQLQDIFWVLKALKENFGFDYLVDIHSVDHYRDDQRFEVGYNIFNLTEKKRIRVKTFVEEDNAFVDSATDIWKSADWYEREVFDMMGIRFNNHPDLRRIYMPEDFEYYPMRKEFPLIGIPGSIQLPDKGTPK
jgi:NADH-quinone oxidoreductase subunit C